MSLHRGCKSLLALAVLTSGLLGCTPLTMTEVDPKDGLGTSVETPGNQLLSNGAASAISDVVATLRDVGAIKNMANPEPLLSNNASGNLLSNGMAGYRLAGYRVANTDMPADDFERIVWTDSNAEGWPGDGSGVITGTLDGAEVERYAYTVEDLTETTYKRVEVVEKSFFRPLGTYTIDGTTAVEQPDDKGRTVLLVAGTCTYTAEGGTPQALDYQLRMHLNDSNDAERVAMDVTGVTPKGTTVAIATLYTDELQDDTRIKTLSGSGTLTVDGRSLAFESAAEKVGTQLPSGHVALALGEDFRLHFAFAPDQPLLATQRKGDDSVVKTLTTVEGTTKVLIEHPDGKDEHLDLMVLPKLYRLALATVLPPL